MSKEMRRIVILLVLYFIALWIGFRSGEIYNRMKNKVKIEKVVMPYVPPPKSYYAVEISDDADKIASFHEIPESHVLMKFYNNEKLRPLLKLRNIRIYTEDGDRIY